jgi:hypothetical protein
VVHHHGDVTVRKAGAAQLLDGAVSLIPRIENAKDHGAIFTRHDALSSVAGPLLATDAAPASDAWPIEG